MQYLLQYIYNAAGFDLFKKKRSTGRRVVFLFGISFSLLFPLWFSYISYKLRPFRQEIARSQPICARLSYT